MRTARSGRPRRGGSSDAPGVHGTKVGRPKTVGAEPVGEQPVGPQPVGPQPVGPEPVGPQPIDRAAAGADPEDVARQICLRLLAAAPRTKAELAAALRRRGVPADAAGAVLERFAEVKLIDDQLFASAWVESRHHGRGLASRALGAELRKRGVGQDDIRAALGELSAEQELATARELIERRMPATAGMPPVARMRRLTGVLARKGYSPGLAYRIVREALEQEPGVDPVPFVDLEELPTPDGDDVPAEPWGA